MSEYVYALHDFHPEDEDEIALLAGDRLEVIQKHDENWWQGKKVDGKVGLFPKSHVISALLTPEYVYATYDFYPQHRDEIHLRAGDRIEVVQKYDDSWLQGKKLDGSFGLFPQSYTVPAPLTPEYVYAIFDFHPEYQDEIYLSAGDRIEVVQKFNDGWCQGKNFAGRFGFFPQNYTSPIPHNSWHASPNSSIGCRPTRRAQAKL
ncbi:SH3 domain containing protein [Amanita muscaria]